MYKQKILVNHAEQEFIYLHPMESNFYPDNWKAEYTETISEDQEEDLFWDLQAIYCELVIGYIQKGKRYVKGIIKRRY